MVKPRHYLNLYFYVYLNVSCQTELCLLRSKGKKKKILVNQQKQLLCDSECGAERGHSRTVHPGR